MPNWCSNHVEVIGKREDIEPLVKAIRDEENGEGDINRGLLHAMSPQPEDMLFEAIELSKGIMTENWYDWRIEHWGTKWEVEVTQYFVSEDGTRLSAAFQSAWAPPIEAYGALVGRGLTVRAEYYEPGWGFIGEYTNGSDNCVTVNPDTDINELEKELPRACDHFDVRNDLEEWKEYAAKEAEREARDAADDNHQESYPEINAGVSVTTDGGNDANVRGGVDKAGE